MNPRIDDYDRYRYYGDIDIDFYDFYKDEINIPKNQKRVLKNVPVIEKLTPKKSENPGNHRFDLIEID